VQGTGNGRTHLNDYFECVTLGAFSFRDEKKVRRFFDLIKGIKPRYIALHLLVVTFALNFPVMLAIARLSPFETYSRLYGDNFVPMLPVEVKAAFPGGVLDHQVVEDFNLFMMQNSYGQRVLLPLIAFIFGIVLILQAAFYGTACFFMRLQRLHFSRLSYKERLGILAWSSTLPVFLSALLGLWMPTLHIIVFYFAVILTGFGKAKFEETAV
jgi:hypothetical protein